MNKWIQIKATAERKYLDDLCAVMGMIDNSLMIEDYSDVERDLDGVYGDLIDDALLKKDRTTVSVSVFISDAKNPFESEGFISLRFSQLGIPVTVEHVGIDEEDWASSWKQYYKPQKTGEKIVIVPIWENYTPKDGEQVVLMDPGMAFGTGTHETTRLCAALLEKHIKAKDLMLDVGCGSGILAVCASKLGADNCFACDIDDNAVRIAKENARLNKTDNITVRKSDLLKQVEKVSGGYDICCANIVADIIIRMAPDIGGYIKNDGKIIVSGIVLSRKEETVSALEKYGWKLIDYMTENDWFAGVLQR